MRTTALQQQLAEAEAALRELQRGRRELRQAAEVCEQLRNREAASGQVRCWNKIRHFNMCLSMCFQAFLDIYLSSFVASLILNAHIMHM